MQQITSLQNPLIKKIYSLREKKNRNDLNLFLIEGFKGINEAIKSGLKIDKVFINKDCDRLAQILNIFSEDNVYAVNEQILKKISTTESPPEIVATSFQFKYSLEDIFKSDNPIIVLLENIKDPGNLGTIIRTAKAANTSGIILTDESVDIYNPKTVRSSAFNVWKIPVVCMKPKNAIKENINKLKHCQFLATSVDHNINNKIYYNIDYNKPTVIAFGSESEGLSEEMKSIADKLINIPMCKQVESLNLSISVGIILFEGFKQRNLAQ